MSKELKGRILAYAREVRYVPHKASQVLKRNKVRKIAIFSSSLPHYFWNDIRTGISIARGADPGPELQGQLSHRSRRGTPTSTWRRLEEEIRDGVEAIAFVNQWIYRMDEIITRITRAGIPYVTLNVDAPESSRLCYIGPDYRAGGGSRPNTSARRFSSSIARASSCSPRCRTVAWSSRAPDINELRYERLPCGHGEELPRHSPRHGVHNERACAHRPPLATSLSSWRAGTEISTRCTSLPPTTSPFIRALEETGSGRRVVVLHDLDSSSNHLLEKNLLTAVIYQNPILQGYYAVRTMENLLESGHPPDVRQINVVHSVILNENKDLYRNHTFFAIME